MDNRSCHRLVLDIPFANRSIVSYGLIVVAKDTKRWVIVQRKNSAEFLLFMRGIYRISHLGYLLSAITEAERDMISKCLQEGPVIFDGIYAGLHLDPSNLKYAKIRMAESYSYIKKILPTLDLSKNTLQWTWPKGRLQFSAERETPFDCARREFLEEIEVTLPAPLFISDSYFSETIKTFSGKNIESRFWIYVVPKEFDLPVVNNHPELSNRIWTANDSNLIISTIVGDVKQSLMF